MARESRSVAGGPPLCLEQIRLELRAAVHDLSVRGLKLAAKWAAEQLSGLPPHLDGSGGAAEQPLLPAKDRSDAYIAAKCYFDVGEYHRAAYTIEAAYTPKPPSSEQGRPLQPLPQRATAIAALPLTHEERFLRAYSLYLSGEKWKEERMHEVADALERSQVTNANLKPLACELQELYERQALDGFGLYIYGVVLKEMRPRAPPTTHFTPDQSHPHGAPSARQRQRTPSPAPLAPITPSARVILIESVQAYPYNWSAWLDLAEVCIEHVTGPNADGSDPLPADVVDRLSSLWMYDFFQTHLLLEQHQSEQASLVLQRLAQTFPASPYVLAQTAIAQYNMRDFDKAQSSFHALRERDPYRLENLERYSDILYVKESHAELSLLAHEAAKNDKYRPETCCIVGNYYSLKGQHERAVMYFQRALKLNRRFLFAWTLMGHGFLEMKNTGAAIEAYRRAVDINARDYRAWYGLGQTYELLQMFFYAIYYYRKAANLRPFDARMWTALGVCYEHLDKRQEAIKCYERALCNSDREGIATCKLARLYREHDEDAKAAQCYQRHLDNRERLQADTNDTRDALLFLAHYHRKQGNFQRVTQYCTRLLDMSGREQEEAKALLREIRSIEGGHAPAAGRGSTQTPMDTDTRTPQQRRRPVRAVARRGGRGGGSVA